MTALNKQALIAKIKKQTESFDTVVLKEDEANALLDELKSSENNLIDSECHVAELEEALRDKQALLEAAEKRIAELEAKLAVPVKLPKTNGYWTDQEKAFEEGITLAKRQIRLAGFRCEGDE